MMEFPTEQIAALEFALRASLSGLATLPHGYHSLPPVEKHAAAIAILTHVTTLADQGDANAVLFLSQQQPREVPQQVDADATTRMVDVAQLIRDYLDSAPPYPDGAFAGRGIVTCAGGPVYQLQAWVLFSLLRRLGCTLPIECWYAGAGEDNHRWRRRVEDRFGVTCRDAVDAGFAGHCFAPENVRFNDFPYTPAMLTGYALKSFAMRHSAFREVLFLDADNCPTRDPAEAFTWQPYAVTGAVFWPDLPASPTPHWGEFGLPVMAAKHRWEVGQMLVNKERCWRALCLADWFHAHAPHFFAHSWGDTGTFQAAWEWCGLQSALPAVPKHVGDRVAIEHVDFDGRPIFYHRAGPEGKWRLDGPNPLSPGFMLHDWCTQAIEEFQK